MLLNFILFTVLCFNKGKYLFPVVHSFSKTIEWINCIADFRCVNSIPIIFFSLSQKDIPGIFQISENSNNRNTVSGNNIRNNHLHYRLIYINGYMLNVSIE